MSDDQRQDDVAALSREGYQLLKQSAYPQASQRFERVLKIEPENCYALVGLGDIARKESRPRDAVAHYEQCLQADPDNAFALFGLADSYRALRRHHDALRIWERYLEHDSENVTVLTRVADAYRKVRRKDRSQHLYQKVLEIDSSNPYALIGLGHLHYEFREYAAALECWMRMYELAGADADIRVLTSIGNSYRKLKEFDAGIPFFTMALEKEQDNFYALFGLADCYRGLNMPQQSLEYWSRILDRDPKNKVILTRAGDAYRSMGDLGAATRCYEDALAIDDDVYAALGLAIISRTHGDMAGAISRLEALRLRHTVPRVYTELAATYADAGRSGEAVKLLASYPAGGPESAYIEELVARYR